MGALQGGLTRTLERETLFEDSLFVARGVKLERSALAWLVVGVAGPRSKVPDTDKVEIYGLTFREEFSIALIQPGRFTRYHDGHFNDRQSGERLMNLLHTSALFWRRAPSSHFFTRCQGR